MTPNELYKRALEQREEIKTIKPRTFSLRLSDADVKRLYETAHGNGITPEQLLEGFIGDLVCGTYTHGSDEVSLAQSYFDRCGYAYDDKDFLAWLLSCYRMDDVADLLDTIDDATGELEYYANHTDDPDLSPDTLQELKETRRDAERELLDIYHGYNGRQDYSDGIAAVRRYLLELADMTARGATNK